MRVLVTGGAGFIGSHICKALVTGGHDVTCLDNFDPYYDPAYKRQNVEGVEMELVEGSVTDFDLVKRLCQEVDYVFHEAAQAGVRASVENPLKSYEVNTGGTLNVLRAAVDSDVKRVINASSSSVYGKIQYLPFDEKHPNTPISPYGVSKLAAEHYCNVFSEVYGIKTVNVRYFTVYGPRMRPDLAISIFTKSALAGRPIEIYGNGKKTRDFTHIDDIVGGNMILMKRGSGTYNLGSGRRISVEELAEKIKKLAGSKSRIVHSRDKKGDVEHTWANVEKAKRELDWKPTTTVDEGLRKFVEYIKNEEI
ncbi:MAG: SDR family oxidoreductase [Candidatus Altiarchaeota archaeon]|nr:SDR family oxidoreductase [Candidatus Altiarchaeota archaeon]